MFRTAILWELVVRRSNQVVKSYTIQIASIGHAIEFSFAGKKKDVWEKIYSVRRD
jgi:hypothetical protein